LAIIGVCDLFGIGNGNYKGDSGNEEQRSRMGRNKKIYGCISAYEPE